MLTARGQNNYTNDANGNTLTGGGRTNVWDSQNRLYSSTVGGATTSFTYGSDGLRRSLTSSGTTTYYALDGQNVAREMRTINDVLTPTATYLNGLRGTECRYDDQTGQIRWYLFDGLGSSLGEIGTPDGNNNPVKCTRKMDVYGAVRASTGTAQSNNRFCGNLGHSTDPETGLIYMRARYMDPVVGRFVSEDPALNGVNWFVYCNSNPVSCVDQSGEAAVFVTIICALLIIAIVAEILAVAFPGEHGPGLQPHEPGEPPPFDRKDMELNPENGIPMRRLRGALDQIDYYKQNGTVEEKIAAHYAEILIYEKLC